MGRSLRTSNSYIGTIEIRSGKDCRLRRFPANNRPDPLRKGFLSGDHGSAFQERVVACHRHDHRSAGAQISLQRPGDKGELELDTADAALDCAVEFQPKRARENALNAWAAGKDRAGWNTTLRSFGATGGRALPNCRAVVFEADSSNPYLRALFDRGADFVAPFSPGTVVVTDVIQA